MRLLDTTEQRARALVVLRAAEEMYREKRGTLHECIKLSGVEPLDSEYALRVLRGVLWELDIPGWEAHPMRRRADVWAALKTAIRWCSRRRGGWSVTGVEHTARANVPPNRQWLEWSAR